MLPIGAALGFCGGLFGIGGGIIAIPLLALGFGLTQPLAHGTALVLMVPNLLVAWWRYQRLHPVAWRAVAAIGLTAMATTWLLARTATRLDPHVLRGLFCAGLFVLALRMLRQGTAAAQAAPAPAADLNVRLLPVVGALGGTSMGLLGIGGGLVATPLLAGWMRQRQTVAQSLALALVAPSSVVALATYAGAQRVDWSLGLPMAVGGLLTVSAGVTLAHRLPEARMRRAFAWMLLVTTVWLGVAPLLTGHA
jgi:uncharacterized membrane protein YfcA